MKLLKNYVLANSTPPTTKPAPCAGFVVLTAGLRCGGDLGAVHLRVQGREGVDLAGAGAEAVGGGEVLVAAGAPQAALRIDHQGVAHAAAEHGRAVGAGVALAYSGALGRVRRHPGLDGPQRSVEAIGA